jgi:hypothetical protein
VLQEVELPVLPSNAKYLHHPNECFDWGTFGWALEQEKVQVKDYKYFIFLNSSVRGPFLPPYLRVRCPSTDTLGGGTQGSLIPLPAPHLLCMFASIS